MLFKLIKFLKNLHPIKNFARPIHASRQQAPILAFSYEALSQDLQETTMTTRLETTMQAFQEQDTYSSTMITAQLEDEHEHESSNVMVMPKVEYIHDQDFILATETKEEPIMLPEPPEKVFKLKVIEVDEQVEQYANLPESIIIDVPVIEISETQDAVAEQIEKPKKSKKKVSHAPVKEKSMKPAVKSKKDTKEVKKTTKKKPVSKISSPRKKTIPPEAMGFGF
jgi:hypothetical protein